MHCISLNLKKNSELKEQSPHLLCLSLHTHESFFVEGIAQFFSLLAIEKGSPIPYREELAGSTYGWTLTMALARANITAILKGERTLDEAVKFHVERDNSGRRSAESTRRPREFCEFTDLEPYTGSYENRMTCPDLVIQFTVRSVRTPVRTSDKYEKCSALHRISGFRNRKW